MPRGDYTLVSTGSGPHLTRPLAISRDQEVDLAFYSWLDILLALGVLLAVAGGMALWGTRRRRRAATPLPGPTRPSRVEVPARKPAAPPVEDPDDPLDDVRENSAAEPAVTTGSGAA